MIVSELIALLQTMPPNAKVVVRGYEDGVDDVSNVRQCLIALNEDTNWWNGTYVATENGTINAVHIIEVEKDRF